MNLSYICIIAALVSLVTAAPGLFGSNGDNGIFGQGDNPASNVYDKAACIVSNAIGGKNPL
ncbi:hypothetical protein BGZ47_001094, partial [Haplosporangium gracile]